MAANPTTQLIARSMKLCVTSRALIKTSKALMKGSQDALVSSLATLALTDRQVSKKE